MADEDSFRFSPDEVSRLVEKTLDILRDRNASRQERLDAETVLAETALAMFEQELTRIKNGARFHVSISTLEVGLQVTRRNLANLYEQRASEEPTLEDRWHQTSQNGGDPPSGE